MASMVVVVLGSVVVSVCVSVSEVSSVCLAMSSVILVLGISAEASALLRAGKSVF